MDKTMNRILKEKIRLAEKEQAAVSSFSKTGISSEIQIIHNKK